MLDDNSTVEYRAHPFLPAEFYRIGDDGSVWSCRLPCQPRIKTGPWRRVKQYLLRNGYCKACIRAGGRTSYLVHRLVLEAFVGPCPAGMECRHENGSKADNRLSNLSWGTHHENATDTIRLGRQVRGSYQHNARLTEADIPIIRSRLAVGETMSAIALDYRVAYTTIRRIRDNRGWLHVPNERG